MENIGKRSTKRRLPGVLIACLVLAIMVVFRSDVMLRETTAQLAAELESVPSRPSKDDARGFGETVTAASARGTLDQRDATSTTTTTTATTTVVNPIASPNQATASSQAVGVRRDNEANDATASKKIDQRNATTTPIMDPEINPGRSLNKTVAPSQVVAAVGGASSDPSKTGLLPGPGKRGNKPIKLNGKPPNLHFAPNIIGTRNLKKEPRIVYLLHIHKNAGTTMCRAAASNRFPAQTKTNCNVQVDQRCCGGNDTLEAQQAFANTTILRFVAAEREMYDAMDTDHYRYIIVLRKSHDRYLSHYKHMVRLTKYNETFTHWWQGQSDNFTFRKICGTQCAIVPKYHITESLFNYTLDRFSKFEDYLFIENFPDSYVQFAQRVGWDLSPGMILNKTPKVKAGVYPDLSGWDPLMSALEDSLYEYAQQSYGGVQHPVFSDEVLQGLRTYFAEGPLRNCGHPCCAEKCSAYR